MQPSWEPGLSVGPYRLRRRLREGGMAELWLAEQETKEGFEGFSRQVAIKAVRAQFADDPSFRAMFVHEAELSAQVSHPNVIRVENVGEHAGRPYLAMELIEGRSLEELLLALGRRKRRLAPTLAVWIVGQVLDGLHAAHGARDGRSGEALRIVHRDVSPPNVMLSSDGAVKVVDFGVAKAARALGPLTEPGTVKGKPAYMSPEQARGESAQVDLRTDVYAAGIVLWEALTGRRLFKGENANATLRQAMFPELAPPSSYAPEVTAELDAVVLRGLATEPVDRPASAAELKRELLSVVPEAKEDRRETLAALVHALLGEDRSSVLPTFPSEATIADAGTGL
ncbi:MAG: serine/threonine-protein kinase, partial [Myxococcota bacterium]